MNPVALRAEHLELRQGGHTLLNGLDIELRSGECWALLGRNGAGKTTLLHTLAGVRQPDSGQVSLFRRPLEDWPPRERARQLGLLIQDAREGFEETVLEATLAGRHPHLGRWQGPTAADQALACEALLECGLHGFEQSQVHDLSGGERRRLAIATLRTQNTPVMLLDEPLNHLDPQWQWCMLGQLRDLANQGRTLMMSLHDPNMALRFCTHALLLDGAGGWRAGPVNGIVTEESLTEIYGLPMRAIADVLGIWLIPGLTPGSR
ncbi:MAG: ABC transporter ATP-binding protein [Pseudomonadota bacterium]